jgi:ribosomal protein S18 acetylase RimI-like enzyme
MSAPHKGQAMPLTIRDAQPQDEADWRALWTQYLQFYDVQLTDEVTMATWSRIIDPASPLQARFAFDANKMLGFALHHIHLSTWVLAPDCYLEDLFLTEAARGMGAGRALMDDLITICQTKGYARLYWHTDEGNARARKLYDSYTPTDGHVRYRVKL